ncbi:MAG: erythromycin esterase family protein [Maribacter sp.]|nr:erythromycin esterase family protein [Maribacter sp.]
MDISHKRTAILKENTKQLTDTLAIDELIGELSGSRIVLLGEASHGTHEYYTWRAAISKRLIQEHGFDFIAVEGDWPDFYRVNRYVKHYGSSDSSSVEVLKQFNRWPTWMWANWEMETLTNWLHSHNEHLPANKRVGIYGLDVYSLWESMEAIIDYLKTHDANLLPAAKRAMGCFEPFGDEKGMAYARSLQRFMPKTCEDEVVTLLRDIRQRAKNFNTDVEASLNMEQNAFIAKNAEKYYRSMVHVNQSSWNLRDHHMMDTLKRLFDFYGPESKGIVWEHNTHVGDARATDMVLEGTINVGQLVREQLPGYHPKIVGFGSYKGTVIAGSEWGAPMRNMHVPEGIVGSWEYLLHQTGKGDQLLCMDTLKTNDLFNTAILHRAIGVVYHPQYEHFGNYVPSMMPERYDYFIHIDTSEGVHAMDIYVDRSQLPETYPWAF